METTIARQLADYAKELSFGDLPPEVVKQTKRCILDAMTCAFGGYAGESSRILQDALGELNGSEESTVIGSGIRTSCLNAALANGLMVRYLDYNDYYRNQPESQDDQGIGGGVFHVGFDFFLAVEELGQLGRGIFQNAAGFANPNHSAI